MRGRAELGVGWDISQPGSGGVVGSPSLESFRAPRGEAWSGTALAHSGKLDEVTARGAFNPKPHLMPKIPMLTSRFLHDNRVCVSPCPQMAIPGHQLYLMGPDAQVLILPHSRIPQGELRALGTAPVPVCLRDLRKILQLSWVCEGSATLKVIFVGGQGRAR